MATTRWRDTQIDFLDDAIRLLSDKVDDDNSSSGISRRNWNIKKYYPQNQTIALLSKEFEYNYISYSFDKIDAGLDGAVVPQSGFIIAYSNGTSINYIIDRNSDAKIVLRKMLSYTGKNEIDKFSFEFDSDFFLWLINRIYYPNNIIEISDGLDTKIELESIKGFRGNTEDAQTKVTASGETILNIISTLSFFLESTKLIQIKLELKYRDHEKIELILQNGTLVIDCKSYLGSLDNETQEAKIAKLYLMGYIEIIPILKQEYKTDIENELWNTEKYLRFMNDVSDELKRKIQNKIDAINSAVLSRIG